MVEIDLPEGDDPYAHAAELFEHWQMDGVLTRDREPALWALTQTYRAPDGTERVRHGFFCRVRITDYGPGMIRPHERTHPAAKEDRLRLMRATRANLSPIFSLYRRSGRGRLVGARARHRVRAVGRGHRRRRHRAPSLARRRPRRDRRVSRRRWRTASC